MTVQLKVQAAQSKMTCLQLELRLQQEGALLWEALADTERHTSCAQFLLQRRTHPDDA